MPEVAPSVEAVRESLRREAYEFSEEALRSLLSGDVSGSDVEAAVAGGQVIEVRTQAGRRPSVLICGVSERRPIHVVCSRSEGGEVTILFVYRPAPPVWKTALVRNPMESRMDNGAKLCFFCGGRLKQIVAGNFDYRREGKLYVVKKMPAALCEDCGEKYISAEVAKKIEGLIEAGRFTGTDVVQVLEFAP